MAPELTNNLEPTEDLLASFRALAGASPLPMVGLEGTSYVVRYVNSAFCALTNRSEDELIGQVFSGITRSGDECLSLLSRVDQTGQAATHTGRERGSFDLRSWSYVAWPVLAGSDHRRGIILQLIEETALHQDAIAANEALTLGLIRQHELTEAAELANAQLQAEIVSRKKTEEALIVSEKLSSVGRMAAVIAHEINNPLAAVMDLLYLMKTVDGTPSEVLAYLETADGELKRIVHITRQTLGFYREISAPTSFHIASLLDSVLDLLQAKVKSKHATVEKECDEQLQIEAAVYGELRQVISNLVVNSLDAVREGGRVTLRASISIDPKGGRDRVRITVADNGQGIKAEALPQIFEPFFTTKGEIGNGLGLWVSKQIIDKHGGAVQVRSCTNGAHRGTTFSVVLPAGVKP